MLFSQNTNIEKEISELQNGNISENIAVLKYSSQKYYLIVQLKEETCDLENEKRKIVITVENENVIKPITFQKSLRMENFNKLGKLFKLNESIEEVYNFILSLLTKNNIVIKNIIEDNSLILSLKETFPGYENPFSAEIILYKKDRNTEDLISDLYLMLEKNNNTMTKKYKTLKENNILLKEKYRVLDEIKDKIIALKKINKYLKKNNDKIPLYNRKGYKIVKSIPSSKFNFTNFSKNWTSLYRGRFTSNINKK